MRCYKKFQLNFIRFSVYEKNTRIFSNFIRSVVVSQQTWAENNICRNKQFLFMFVAKNHVPAKRFGRVYEKFTVTLVTRWFRFRSLADSHLLNCLWIFRIKNAEVIKNWKIWKIIKIIAFFGRFEYILLQKWLFCKEASSVSWMNCWKIYSTQTVFSCSTRKAGWILKILTTWNRESFIPNRRFSCIHHLDYRTLYSM